MDPIKRSAQAFCHGDRRAVRISSVPIAGAVVVHAEKTESRSRSLVPRERFAELSRRPRRRGLVGDRDMHDTAALVRQDHEHKREPARRGRHDEEVGRRDLSKMICQ